MHTALLVTGYGALAMIVATGFFYHQADRPGDDFGAAVPAVLSGGFALVLGLTWLGLVIYKAATA